MSFWCLQFSQKTNENNSTWGKGQLISKCPFGFIVWTKIPTKLFLDFCPEFFVASWGLHGSSLGFLGYVISNKEACRKPQKASRKPPGRYKKFQGRNRAITSLVFWKKFSDQEDILKLTDLYLPLSDLVPFPETYLIKDVQFWQRYLP